MASGKSRRTPSQRRGRESVDAIVEACAQVLVQHGWDGVTTNRVADRAGVSVGTLYQYFANRDEVLRAVRDRVLAEQLDAVARASARVQAQAPGFETAVDQLVDAVLAVVAVRPELVRRLILDAPAPDLEALDGAFKDRTNQLVRGLLYAGGDRVRAGSVDVMATLLVSAVWGMVRDVVVHRPDLLAAPELRPEITRMIRRFLEP